MAAAIYKDPNTVTYDATATTGCIGITAAGGNTPATAISDAGTFTHYAVKGAISGTVTYNDPAEAAKVADKVAATKNLTFKVKDHVDAEKTVTITNYKSGSVQVSYSTGGVASYSVAFVADSISAPA